MSARLKRLQVGDIVSAEARIIFCDGRARLIAAELGAEPHLWRTICVDGTVLAKASSGRWTVQFQDADAAQSRTVRRSLLDLNSRPVATAAAAMVQLAGVEAAAVEVANALGDSDDNASVASDAAAVEELQEPDDCNADEAAEQHDGVWQRDDHADISQRARDKVDHEYRASLNGFSGNFESESLITLGKHSSLLVTLKELANIMEKIGGQSRKKSDYTGTGIV